MPAVVTPGGRIGNNDPLGKPGAKNWVAKRGGLPDYIREVARGINPADPEAAIPQAIAAIKRWASGGGHVTPKVRAAAAAALAHWEAMKGSADLAVTGGQDIDLDWSTFDQNRPAGQGGAGVGGAGAAAAGQQQEQPQSLLTPQTQANISAFQKAHGLPATGQLDAATVAWLNDPANKGASASPASVKKAAAAQTKAAKAAAAAQKQAASAQAKAQKQAAADAAKKAKAAQANQAANDKASAAAVAQARANGAGARVASTKSVKAVSLSVPLVGTNDGARMTGKPAFGGKKAAPFAKGGKRKRTALTALAQAKKRGLKMPATASLSSSGVTDIDLGKDGSKWSHGYIPLNAAAVALKLHKVPTGGGSKSVDPHSMKAGDVFSHSATRGNKVRVLSKHSGTDKFGRNETVYNVRGLQGEKKDQEGNVRFGHSTGLTPATLHENGKGNSSSGKSRLAMMKHPAMARTKVKGDKGRVSTDAHTQKRLAADRSAREKEAIAAVEAFHATGKPLGPHGDQEATKREFQTMAQRRKEAAPRAFVNSGDVRLHATKDDGGSKIGTVSKYPSGGYRAQHKDDVTPHAASPFKTRQEAVGALVLQHEARTPTTQADRVAAIRAREAAKSGKVQVYNVQTGKTEHVSPAEANAGHARYGQSLGAGSPAAGQTVKNALEAENARRLQASGRGPMADDQQKLMAARAKAEQARRAGANGNVPNVGDTKHVGSEMTYHGKGTVESVDHSTKTAIVKMASGQRGRAGFDQLHDSKAEALAQQKPADAGGLSALARVNSHVGQQSPSDDRIGAEAARLSANARANEAARQSPMRDALMAKRSAIRAEMATLPSGSARKAALARQLTTVNRKLAP